MAFPGDWKESTMRSSWFRAGLQANWRRNRILSAVIELPELLQWEPTSIPTLEEMIFDIRKERGLPTGLTPDEGLALAVAARWNPADYSTKNANAIEKVMDGGENLSAVSLLDMMQAAASGTTKFINLQVPPATSERIIVDDDKTDSLVYFYGPNHNGKVCRISKPKEGPNGEFLGSGVVGIEELVMNTKESSTATEISEENQVVTL